MTVANPAKTRSLAQDIVMVPPAPLENPLREPDTGGDSTVSYAAGDSHNVQTSSPTIPETIGRFQIRRFLGEGAFGAVYEGYDPQLDRAVAIKVAKLGRGDSEQRVKRFLREAKAAAGLRHPHIVPVHEFGQEGDHFYIVSTFIQGRTLQDSLKADKDKTPDLARAVRIIIQLAEALAYAHGQGIVHRDVKPANVMLDDKDEPMLMDFGLATRQEEAEKLTHAGAILGTPLYMAPEQALGHEGGVVPTSDQYSLGVILYEMIAGQPPFSGKPEIVMFKHTEEEPPRPSQWNRAIPRDLETICLKCLEKKPEQRYLSEKELAADLQNYLNGEPISVRRAGIFERTIKWVRRKPTLAAAYGVSAAAVLLTVLAVLMGSLWLQAEDARQSAVKAQAEVERGRDTLARFDYGRTMQVAYQAWQDNNVNEALALLEGAEPRLRGWEWHYLHRLCNGHAFLWNKVEQVDLSSDGTRMLTENWRNVSVWNPRTGLKLLQLPPLPETTQNYGAAFTADGKRIISTASDKTARLWNVADGRLLFNAPNLDHFSAIANADGTRVMTMDLEVATVWDTDAGKKVAELPGHVGGINSPLLNADGSRALTRAGFRGKLRLWKTDARAEVVPIEGHAQSIDRAFFSGDGNTLVTADMAGKIYIRKSEDGVIVSKPKEDRLDISSACAISANGQRLAVADYDGRLCIWDAKTADIRTFSTGHTSALNTLAMTPDGKRIVTGSDDRTSRIFDVASGQRLFILKHPKQVSNVDISSDGMLVLTQSREGNDARIWNLEDLPALEFTTRKCKPPLTTLIPWEGGLLGMRREGDLTWGFTNDKGPIPPDDKKPVGFAHSTDGSRAAVAFPNKRIVVWDALKDRELAVLAADWDKHSSLMRFSLDGSKLLLVGTNTPGKVYDTSSGKQLYLIKESQVSQAIFTPDHSRLIVGNFSGAIRIYDAATGVEMLATNAGDHAVDRLALDPTGSKIAVAGLNGNLYFLDAATGAKLAQMKGHTAQITSIAFNPDGTRMCTGSLDKSVRLWDVNSGAEVFRIKLPGGGSLGITVGFSDDGKQIVTSMDGRTEQVWNSAPVASIITID